MTVIFPIETEAQRQVLGVALAFSILAVTAVCLRLLAHRIGHKKWTASDYFLIVACIFAVGLQSISITGVFQAGIGYGHTMAIAATYGMGPITKLLQLIIPLQFLWVLSLSCTKISILLLYLRIFPVAWVARISWATIGVIVAWAVATILAGCLICRPFAFNWDQTIPGGSCGNQVSSFTATGIINLVTDVVVLIAPMPSLYRLQMATYKKVTLMIVFGLGVVTCIISALRISVLSKMNFADITYTLPLANIFSGIEPCLAIILASIPMMRPLLGRSTYTPSSSGLGPSKESAPSTGPKAAGGDGFQQLVDDSTHFPLRPIGPKHFAGITVQTSRSSRGRSGGSEESLNPGQNKLMGEGQMDNKGIRFLYISITRPLLRILEDGGSGTYLPQEIVTLCTHDAIMAGVHNLPFNIFSTVSGLICRIIMEYTKEAKPIIVTAYSTLFLNIGLIAVMQPPVNLSAWFLPTVLIGWTIGASMAILYTAVSISFGGRD
ncbi:hypothetical protein FE257_010449 [Aspergillus nanangensis]|uniref:Rhodopsin domain-containing protein n=1 Tax=Aspergillus nanangensis TaxID=2582783 RepID=A0AAD4CIN5_ASPNN|nr:hypothetical protein FE257_010449 [Aspergillus nanangensis]